MNVQVEQACICTCQVVRQWSWICKHLVWVHMWKKAMWHMY